MSIAEEFERKWNFPNAIGAIDVKHITFSASKSLGSAYYNYKNSHSIVLLALVDANYNFRYIDIGCNGRVSDGGVFLNSSLYKALFQEGNVLNLPESRLLPGRNTKMPYVILVNGAFSLSSSLMKPFSLKGLSSQQRVFNYRLSRGRRVVENAFGLLANRFRVLLNCIHLRSEKVQKIRLACCALHNFLRKKCPSFTEENERVNNDFTFKHSLEQQGGNRSKNSARDVREQFTNYFNEEGPVPWQNNLELMF